MVMTMEEVLPRPQAGLLNRMLRLANVPLRALPGARDNRRLISTCSTCCSAARREGAQRHRVHIHAGVTGPAFSVKPGREYMVGFRVLQPPHPVAAPLTVNALRWLRVQPTGGQTVRFVVEEEPSQQPGWCGCSSLPNRAPVTLLS